MTNPRAAFAAPYCTEILPSLVIILPLYSTPSSCYREAVLSPVLLQKPQHAISLVSNEIPRPVILTLLGGPKVRLYIRFTKCEGACTCDNFMTSSGRGFTQRISHHPHAIVKPCYHPFFSSNVKSTARGISLQTSDIACCGFWRRTGDSTASR